MATMFEQLHLFNLEEGRRRRDAGMEKVQEHSGSIVDELEAVLDFNVGRRMTGEDIRVLSGLEPHPNAWGMAIFHLIRRGRLVKTGEFKQRELVQSNASKTEIYLVRRRPE